MSLNTILHRLYLAAYANRGIPQTVNLQHGLTITITMANECTLTLTRYWAKWPSAIELQTVISALPIPVSVGRPNQAMDKHKRMLSVSFPIQEMLA